MLLLLVNVEGRKGGANTAVSAAEGRPEARDIGPYFTAVASFFLSRSARRLAGMVTVATVLEGAI